MSQDSPAPAAAPTNGAFSQGNTPAALPENTVLYWQRRLAFGRQLVDTAGELISVGNPALAAIALRRAVSCFNGCAADADMLGADQVTAIAQKEVAK